MARYGDNHRGGRPHGRVNDRTLEVQRFCRSICEDAEYRASILERARTNNLGSMEPVVWAYGYGRPRETVSLQIGREPEDLSALSPQELKLRAVNVVLQLQEAQLMVKKLDANVIDTTCKVESIDDAKHDIRATCEADGAVGAARADETHTISPTACPASTAPSQAEDV